MLCPACNTANPASAATCSLCSAPLNTAISQPHYALPAGTRLQNATFTTGPIIGQGGFGLTYAGHDVRLQRTVAIKEFFPEGCVRRGETVEAPPGWSLAQFTAARERFLQEGQTLARFDHPGIVKVFALFEEFNTVFMVMEFLKGQTLLQLLEERRVLPEARAVGYIARMAAALDMVHGQGLLHRDVKPENVMVCDDGRVVLIDFGLTKKVEKTAGQGTRRLSGTVNFGTPAYAPLEQYTQQTRFDESTDVYSLGATLYHLITGQMPVPATDRANGTPLLPPAQVNPHLTQKVSDCVMWAMQMKAPERPQTMRDFVEALRQGVRGVEPIERMENPATSPGVQPVRVPGAATPAPSSPAPRVAPVTKSPAAHSSPVVVPGSYLNQCAQRGAVKGAVAGLLGGFALAYVKSDWLAIPPVFLVSVAAGAAVGVLGARNPRALSTPQPIVPLHHELAGTLYGAALGAIKGTGVGLTVGVAAMILAQTGLELGSLTFPALLGAIGGGIVGAIGRRIEDGRRRPEV